jgi:hypothetical protein
MIQHYIPRNAGRRLSMNALQSSRSSRIAELTIHQRAADDYRLLSDTDSILLYLYSFFVRALAFLMVYTVTTHHE